MGISKRGNLLKWGISKRGNLLKQGKKLLASANNISNSQLLISTMARVKLDYSGNAASRLKCEVCSTQHFFAVTKNTS